MLKLHLKHGQITLRGPRWGERVIPVDADGYFYIDWTCHRIIRY